VNRENWEGRKQAADALPVEGHEDTQETQPEAEDLAAYKARVDAEHERENGAHVIALEADSGVDIRALMETGQIKPKRVPRVELG
jgi:hypothetical protein